jgi:importin subunit beta-1
MIKSIATCISAIAVVEIPRGEWPDLINIMSSNANSENYNIKLAAVQTLGFLCEDLDPANLSPDQLNDIFGAVLPNING